MKSLQQHIQESILSSTNSGRKVVEYEELPLKYLQTLLDQLNEKYGVSYDCKVPYATTTLHAFKINDIASLNKGRAYWDIINEITDRKWVSKHWVTNPDKLNKRSTLRDVLIEIHDELNPGYFRMQILKRCESDRLFVTINNNYYDTHDKEFDELISNYTK